MSKYRLFFTYFIVLILIGTLLFMLPDCWEGRQRLQPIDALFTATSAVCVTGLTAVDTADYSLLGQFIILLLIQAGGLGIITFTTLFLILPFRKMTLKDIDMIKSFTMHSIENNPKTIVKQILLFTCIIETAGTVSLYFLFKNQHVANPLYQGLFHSISAFCNAGFSLFSNNLENFKTNQGISITIALLIICGGIGFPVMQDVLRRCGGRIRRLTYHSKITLWCTVVLLFISTVFILIMEYNNTLADIELPQKVVTSFFQAVTPRTAGFNTVVIGDLSLPVKYFLLILMFIGGGSGSISGGVKISTMFLVLLQVVKAKDENGEIRLFQRKITEKNLSAALILVVRAMVILFLSIMALIVAETLLRGTTTMDMFDLIFESVSAFGTVGLSLGITGYLSVIGKLVIILTMLAGRVGLISVAMLGVEKVSHLIIDYPKEEIMVG